MKEIILGDGGMGTELRFRGVNVPSHEDSLWSALALEEAPEVVEQIHFDYIEAGADYITINNYSLTQPILSRVKKEDQLEELTLKAIEIATNAVKESNKRGIKILGSLPPLQTSYRADLILSEDEMCNKYNEIANLLKNKVDIIICETMSSGLEAKCALNAALQVEADVWVSWTLHGNRPNQLPSGESVKEAFLALENLTPQAYLINCCGANFVGDAIRELNKLTDLPIGGYANSENVIRTSESLGFINAEKAQRDSIIEIDEVSYSKEVLSWIKDGATIVGGCCRTRPSHIKQLRCALKNR